MFEGLVRQLILGYLGKFIKDIQKEQLKITLWNEEVLLENVELILEAFDYLRLPFAFKQGRVGKLSIKIPWKKLGWDPLIIILEDIYICVSRRDDKEWCLDAVKGREFASKKAQLAAAELAKLSRRVCDNLTGKSFISYITAKVLDSIQVSIRNVHILYRDTQDAKEQHVLGLKFSSLTIMRQTVVGSSIAKVRGGQVNKLVEVQNLELYCDTVLKIDESNPENVQSYSNMGWDRQENDQYSSMLSPLNVSVSLSINRSGNLLNDVPQYTIKVDLTCVDTSMDEVQLQKLFSLCDYMSVGQLREKYGCYRPWWSPIGKRLNGWQKAWWHYAQESVLSDVRRRLRKTSWHYFGERLHSCRKYVNLYKAKLKCLRHDQVPGEDVQHELEEMEKETDIDDILNYRSVAELELEDFLLNPSSKYGSSRGSIDKLGEDDRPPNKPRGWLNWLSYGMLGAGGTDDSNQFSGVISDDVVEDIYEATKFRPAPAVIEDFTMMDEIHLFSMNINISEIHTSLQSMKLGQAIADLMLKGITIEGEVWEKSAIMTASVISGQMLNPITNQVVLFTEKVKSEHNVLEQQQPSLNIRVDLSPPNCNLGSSVKVILNPIEVFCDFVFLKNIVVFLHVLQHLSFQQQRVMLSLNGIDDLNSRLLSKIDYVLSCRKKTIWDIDLSNIVVNVPWETVDAHNVVIEVAAISFVSKSQVDSSGSHKGDKSHLLGRCVGFGSGSIGDNLKGFQLQDLYNYFEIQINDAQMKLTMPSTTIVLFEKFSSTANLVSCILPDEPILKGFEVDVQVPSLSVHFSALVYGKIMGLISQLNMLLPPLETTDPIIFKSNGLKTSICSRFSFNASFDEIYWLLNLEDSVAGGCTLNVHCQNLGIRYDQNDFPSCRASLQACWISADSKKDGWGSHVLCSSRNVGDSESVTQHNVGVDLEGQNIHLGDRGAVHDRCIILHFEALGSSQRFIQKFTIQASDLNIHLHPFLVGKFIGFLDKVVVHGASDVDGSKADMENKISPRDGSELEECGLLNEVCSNESECMPLDHFPFTAFENLKSLHDLENIVNDTRFKFGKTHHLNYSNKRPSKFSPMEREKFLTALIGKSDSDFDFSVQKSSVNDLLLVNLNLSRITAHFHDSSCTVGTVVVPLAKVLLTVSADSLDMVCSTERMVLSSPWWSQTISDFLWGPLNSRFSPILNLHLKNRTTGSLNSRLEMSFDIQQVSCILPPDFLAVLIGYFSLPEWSSCAQEQPTDAMNFANSSIITYNFKIVDSNVITPANCDCSKFLKVNIKQLCILFSQNCDRSSVTKDIPSTCCIDAGKFSDRNDCLDFFGCDISLVILENDAVCPLNSFKNLVLISSLSADLWVRIPNEFESDVAPYPTCIMAVVRDCQLHADELCLFAGFKALDYAFNQFSLVDEESKLFTSDILHFLQAKKQMMELGAVLPRTSNVTFNEMRFCVTSLSLRLHRLNGDSTCSELMAEAQMHFACSLSLINDELRYFDISFCDLSLFSLLNTVVLLEFACPGSGSSVLEVVITVSDFGKIMIGVSFPCLDVWLHLVDWNEVIDLLYSFCTQLSKLTSGSSAESMSGIPFDYNKYAEGDSPAQVASLNITQGAGLSTLTLENIGLAVHFPALINQDTYVSFGRSHFHDKKPLDECHSIPSGKQNCFISISLQSRNSVLVNDGKTARLTSTSENMNGVLKLFTGENAKTLPFFQLSKIYLEADIVKNESDEMLMKCLARCDNLDLSFSNHILYLFQFSWFGRSQEMPSRFNFWRTDLKVQLRKCSLLVTDWKQTSNGPLLEFLVRNFNFWSAITKDEIIGSAGSDLQVNYYSIDKVLWEPLVEPWNFQLSVHRKQDERALFSGTIMTDINLESNTHLNLNLNEPIIEVLSMTIEMIKDALSLIDGTKCPDFPNSQETRRYAPYMLQNFTTLPLVFCVCQHQLEADDSDVSPSQGVLQPGSSTLVYINESPEELLFHYRPAPSSDRLNDKQLLERTHRYVTFQLEGTSVPSTPISMDLVGRRFFEVEFSKSLPASEVCSDTDGGVDAVRGFVIPVVIDVSVQRFTKFMRLYSTVVIFNATSLSLEVRFDIPLGVSPKILGPIYPGQEFPLPLHLAEVGSIRWRPVGDSYLWSEAYRISSIISLDVRIGVFRSFVCYPSYPNSDAFRCCISVNKQYLPPVSRVKRVHSSPDIDNGKQSENFHRQFFNNSDVPKNRFLYQMVLSSPLVLKNYLMMAISVTVEYGGVTRSAFLSEVETSFYHIDCSHDVSITFQMHGFRPSILKYPRAESFSQKAKFSGTKFSVPETIRFDPEFSSGPLYVTMEKVMDAVSGAREIFISVPFLLYNCTGLPLVLSNSVSGVKGHSCIMPSCYNLDKQNVPVGRKDGLFLICADQNLSASGSTCETRSNSHDFVESGGCRKVSACLFSPDPHSYSGEVMVKLSRYLPSVVENFPKRSWSVSFSLVPPTGTTSVLVPQPSMASGYVVSVSAMAAPFSGRTKIITFQPRYVIANACAKNLCYKQKGTDYSFLLGAGQHSYVQWMDTTRDFLLSVRFDGPGWEWSGCFSPEQLGDTQIKVRNYMTTSVSMMHVEVRSADVSVEEEKIVGSTSGNSGTNLILLSDDDTGFMPYRIDNHSRERLRIYQPKCESFETVIHPYTSSPYAWDEPCYPHRLTVEVPGERILGSYAIDDASAHSLVHLPSTLEKPERNLLISVHSEGAIKVLSIIDSSYHVLNDLKSLPVPQLKDKGKRTNKYESFANYKERLSVDIPFFGVSLMNSHPEELLFACAKNTKVNFVQSLDQQLFSLQIGSLQIDNQLHVALYPVILSFNYGNEGPVVNQMIFKDNNAKFIGGSPTQIASSYLHEPVFSLAVAKWRNTDSLLVSFESISLRVADFYLQIEQEIVLRLFEFCKTASSRLQGRVFEHMGSTLNLSFSNSNFTGETSGNARYSAQLDEKHLNSIGTTLLCNDFKRSCLLPRLVPIGAPWQKIRLDARKDKKIYVELFDMEPIKLTLSFSSSPWILRNGILTSGESLIHRGLMALADVEGAQINFKQLVLSHQIASWESIQEILVSHYTRQFLHEMYKVFGSAGVIGNPVGFARSLGLGIKDFFSLPIWSIFQSPAGLITGMALGTTSLLSNTVYAITDATSQFSKAAHKGIVAFTFDDQTAAMVERQHKGISSRSKGVINEFLEGLTGVLQSPIKGAEKHGLPGVLSGIAVGITGLVARPAASILEVTGKTAQSIRNRSRIHHTGYWCFRVRLPRPLNAESPLKPYSWEEAVGTYVLTETDTRLRSETLVMCKALKRSGQYVLITERLIVVFSCPILVDLGKPNFEGVTADPDLVIESEIGMDSVIVADNDGQVVHIVGSGSDALFRQNLQQQKGGNEPKGKPWKNFHSPLPLLQTNLEFTCPEEAEEFLRVAKCMTERGKEQGWGSSVCILHQSNIK